MTSAARAAADVARNRTRRHTEAEVRAGRADAIEQAHDAWVVGDEPFVCYEFESRSADT